jgi:cytochrome c oxidase subunit II
MSFRLGLSVALLACGCLTGCTGWQSALDPHAPQSETIRGIFLAFFAIAVVIWIAVIFVLLVAVLRHKPSRDRPLDLHQRFERRAGRIIFVSGAATTLAVLGLSVLSYAGQRAIFTNEPDPVIVKITGHQWWWEVEYQSDTPHLSFITANEIRVPTGKPVTVQLESADVIHSFWVPSLTGKMDLITGQQNSIQFTANKPGLYRGQCAEFCGYQHAHMAFTVRALPPDEFRQWRDRQNGGAAAPNDPLGIRGEQLFRGKGCALCHTIRGTLAGGQLGPDLTHIASRETLAAGTLPQSPGTMAAWISDPQHIKSGNLMPTMALRSDESIAILHYLEQLK